jgi:hypothetical protein
LSHEAYRRWVEHGPDSLPEKVTSAALDWRDGHPAEAQRVRERLDTERREAEAREDSRAEWLRRGEDPRDFDGVYGELQAERKKEALRRMDDKAKFSFSESILRGF